MSGQWAGSTRRHELPDDWPQRRAYVLARDNHRCRWHEHSTTCGRAATDVDHITPGDDHRYENLQALCSEHHAIKSSREGNDAPRVTRWRPVEPHPGII